MPHSPEKDLNPPVSVIIPCYNHGEYILEAVGSVEACDRSLYELIIIDDGSTDPMTKRVLAELKEKNYCVINQQNQGLAASRNNGIRAARGRYILPLDSDNKIHPEYITLGIEILDKRPEVGVVYGKPELFGNGGARNYPEVGVFDLHQLAISNYIDACALVRKSALVNCGYYDTQFPFPGWEDWDLWLTMATKDWQFHFVDATLFSYRVTQGSMISFTKDPESERLNRMYLCQKHALLLWQIVVDQEAEISNHRRALRYARSWATAGFKGVAHEAFAEVTRKLRKR